ncbi:MAG TPA: hypothetical protein P5186_09440 [Candidatus Paceibacterota bacterium]|nr:hypothetical protein [Verrucomicrobiota bacterium]HRY48258.1 hypothetical protein [Candidatus Paceibacterota bacterium]HSA01647.1 hypothetical protein [Candidatus Paceibacterota bacterium]
MIKDKSVEFRFNIDLTANTVSEYYDNQLLSAHKWPADSGTPGINALQAVDLDWTAGGPVPTFTNGFEQHVLLFNNIKASTIYRLFSPAVASAAADAMQIAEVQLFGIAASARNTHTLSGRRGALA